MAPKKKSRRATPSSAGPRTGADAPAAKRPGGSTHNSVGSGRAASAPVSSPDRTPVIVGVGGSAGSLTPLRELFAALPAASGMAFVVVSHQAPTGHSLLAEILAKTTAMPVREIDGETRVEPNHVYVVPRGQGVAVHDAVLVIEPIGEPRRVPMPIDFFFRALAQDRGHRAVGIILSGTGSDGTLGLAAIRAESGLCLAQDPETAEFDGMPTSAIAANATDFALPVGEMPARLAAHARSVRATARGGEPSAAASRAMERILVSGVNYSCRSTTTISAGISPLCRTRPSGRRFSLRVVPQPAGALPAPASRRPRRTALALGSVPRRGRREADAGACGYVLKANAYDDLRRALEAARQGKSYLCPDVTRAVVASSIRGTDSATDSASEFLTPREREVLQLLAEGLTSPQIGQRLFIATTTAETHRRNIMRKLGIHSVADLTKYAVREGLTPLDS